MFAMGPVFNFLSPNVLKYDCNKFCIPVSIYLYFVVYLTDTRVRFPALPKKKVVSLEWGPLSLVSTTEELLNSKVAAPV
jgi:hypothetical protein